VHLSPEFRFHSTVPDKNELPINSGGVIKACYGRLWPGLVIPFVGMACTWSRPDAATILPEEPGVIRHTVLRISTKVLLLTLEPTGGRMPCERRKPRRKPSQDGKFTRSSSQKLHTFEPLLTMNSDGLRNDHMAEYRATLPCGVASL
jgi:hypothetical protein